jgi:hypothetical protein
MEDSSIHIEDGSIHIEDEIEAQSLFRMRKTPPPSNRTWPECSHSQEHGKINSLLYINRAPK